MDLLSNRTQAIKGNNTMVVTSHIEGVIFNPHKIGDTQDRGLTHMLGAGIGAEAISRIFNGQLVVGVEVAD